jgi:hypothetical protein
VIPIEVLIVGGAVTIGAAAILIARAVGRKRRAAYEEFSLVRGFRFEAERPDGEAHLREVFEPFDQGRNRRWGYTISGAKNRLPFTAFEYRWATGGGKSSSTHRIAGILWERTGDDFPTFVVSPEGWLTRLGTLFGMQDINFEESPGFSRAYRLKGPDEARVRALFPPDVREFFAATPNQQVAGGGRHLLWWQSGRLPAVDALDEWLEQGDHVRRRFIRE